MVKENTVREPAQTTEVCANFSIHMGSLWNIAQALSIWEEAQERDVYSLD